MIDLVAFDADDTLWHNEPFYTTTRERFRTLLSKYGTEIPLDERLYEIELRNLRHFGYGVKGPQAPRLAPGPVPNVQSTLSRRLRDERRALPLVG